MDLNQRKLTKSEWDTIEMPESAREKDILKMITSGFDDINITINCSKSMLSFLKMSGTGEYEKCIDSFVYNTYFAGIIKELQGFFEKDSPEYLFLNIDPVTKLKMKKADIIRVSRTETPPEDIFEYLLLNEVRHILIARIGKMTKKNRERKGDWTFHYFTLYKLSKNRITSNPYVKGVIDYFLELYAEISFKDIIVDSDKYIEQNNVLVKYSDVELYDHQKEIFTHAKSPNPKLIFYIAPTGTGKTLTPLALSSKYKIIFVCAARHVGLSFARACITMNKKIAFAFGCSCHTGNHCRCSGKCSCYQTHL
jgi:hypothetical protein